MLTIVDKVLFLQDVEIFKYTRTEDLAHIAAITEEVEYEKDQIIFKQGGLSNAMYLVIEGEVNQLVKRFSDELLTLTLELEE